MADLIDRQQAIDALREYLINKRVPEDGTLTARLIENEVINKLPSAELPKEYAKSVWLWMLNYQIKAAELQGIYTPYEVLSWVANDWRKENGLD